MYEVYGVFLKRCEEYFLCSYLPPEGVDSVGQHLRLERDIYLQQFPEYQRHQRELIFNYLMARETVITGTPLDNVDLLELGSYVELPGGNISLPSGYSSILRPLAKDIPPERIIKGQPVNRIKWNYEASNTEAETSSINPKIEIKTDRKRTYYCDYVICSVPLGVLQHSSATMFDPPLPDYKLQSLQRLSFGTVDKIYLEYERPLFSNDLVELVLLWEPVDNTEDMSQKWYKKIYSFTKLSETLLIGWISGDEAKYMETLPFEAVADQCTEILRQFLADPFVPKPKRCIW